MKRFTAFLFLVLLFCFQAIQAQVVETEPQDTDEQSTDSSTSSQENLESEFELAAVDEDAGEEEESSERFIPTEQISQDLGVSFPVDI